MFCFVKRRVRKAESPEAAGPQSLPMVSRWALFALCCFTAWSTVLHCVDTHTHTHILDNTRQDEVICPICLLQQITKYKL